MILIFNVFTFKNKMLNLNIGLKIKSTSWREVKNPA